MELPRDPFGVAVGAIRTRLRSGRLVQGEQLMARDLARELRLSATPVREALSRLAGEGLLEDRRGAGYFAWRLDAVDLVELYDLQCGYLRMALNRSREAPPLAEPAPVREPIVQDPVAEIEAALAQLVLRGRSLALQRAHALLADRLAPARRIEAHVLGDPGPECAVLSAALAADDIGDLMALIDRYGAVRRQAAPELVAVMRSGAGALPL